MSCVTVTDAKRSLGTMIFTRFTRYFVEVSRHRSMRSAAEHLNIAPSAVDRQILKMEEELGAPLFERTPQGMRLTAAGEYLLGHIRRWQREFDEVKTQIEGFRGLLSGRVTVALPETLAGDLLAKQVAAFNKQYPRVSIIVLVVAGARVPDLVRAGDADVGLTFTAANHPALRVERSVGLPIGVAVTPDHPLVQLKQVRLRDCVKYPIVLPDSAKVLRGSIDFAFARAKLELKPAAVASSFAIMKALVLNRVGIALLSRADVIGELEEKKLVFLDLADRGVPLSILSLVTGNQPSVAAAQLTQWLVKSFDALDPALKKT